MRKLKNILLLSSIFIITVAFDFKDNPPSGWYQQFLPNINNRPISDMLFLDSLTGYIVTPYVANDSAYILKTTDGGDNWNVLFRQPTNVVGGFNDIQFLNQTTGFACGNFLWKTTNSGINWFNVNTSGIFPEHMFVLNQDTIWIIDHESLTGGVFRTTNGGVNWTRQLAIGNDNPTHIYFYNKDIGFAASGVLYKTTNGGVNWFNTNQTGFGDMQFINETTGWKSYGPILKTTDGGLNWINLPLPNKGGSIALSRVNEFHALNEDTIWGVGSALIVGTGGRGIIYLTKDGGQTWGYQLPDTSIHSGQYQHIQFLDNNKGWSYWSKGGVHTITGGNDTTIIVSISQNETELPENFILHQNYPNPFNPNTIINYQLTINSLVTIKVFDLQGKEIQTLVNKKQSTGSYSVDFNAANLPSGIYFYTLLIDGATVDTKKMLLIK